MKNRLIRISPSILCIDYNDDIVLKLALDKIEQSGAHMVHLDVMDGKFVPNKTFDHKLVDKIKDMTSLMLDVHLMVEKPHDKIADYAQIAVTLSGNDTDCYSLCIISRTEDARAIGAAAIQVLNGRGGGRKEAFQGSVSASKQEIEQYFARICDNS